MTSTTVYWLVDMRPTVLKEWPRGLPFYCGLTTLETDYVLEHMRKYSEGATGQRLKECGRHVSVYVVAVVPAGANAYQVRRRSIWILRQQFPGCVNRNPGPRPTKKVKQRAASVAADKRKLLEKRLRNVALRRL